MSAPTPLSVLTLIAAQTADAALSLILDVARLVGLPVDTWRTGDPTRTQFRALARKIETADAVRAELAKSAFLDTAEGDWLKVRVLDVYNVEAEEAGFSTPTLTLDNAGGGLYEVDARGLTVKSSVTGASFVNQASFTINPSETGVAVLLVAEVAGTDGSVGIDEIDTIVSPALTGVSIAGNTAGVGTDAQSDESLREQARASLGALSPDGPADAYEFIARDAELTGVEGVTRALAAGDSADGTVTVYVGTATAAIGAPDLASIQDAIDTWAQPLCTDATVASMTPVSRDWTFTITPAMPEMQDPIEIALDAYFAEWDHAREGGIVALDAVIELVRTTIREVQGEPAIKVVITDPVVDLVLAENEFPVRGTVTLA